MYTRVSSVAQSCLTLWDSIDGSPPGLSVHGIPQARILEWVAISSPVVYICNGKLCSYKKNEILLFVATLRNLEIIIPNEDRQKQMSYDIMYRWNLKYDTNELIYKNRNKLTGLEISLMITKGAGKG